MTIFDNFSTNQKEKSNMEQPEYKTRQFFQARGIHPTLAEYREVYACMKNGSNPLGIH